MKELIQHTDNINELLARYGVKFGIYKNNTFKEQLFPFDSIPRVITSEEFLNTAKSDREGGRTVGSGRVSTIIGYYLC